MRARRTDGEQTRERILEAALPLFAELGFAGTSTRKLADGAGVNVATLAYHFGGKEGLYQAVIERLYEELGSTVPKAEVAGTPQETVRAWMAAAWQFCKDHREHIRLTVRHVLDQGRWSDVMNSGARTLLPQADGLIGLFRPGWTIAQRRLLVFTVQHALVRFVLEERSQLAWLLGCEVETLDQEVVDHFSRLVCTELGLTPG